MTEQVYKKNLAYLEEQGLEHWGQASEREPWSVELNTHTKGGEDMWIALAEPTEECLQEYIDGFDINHEVMIWWMYGKEKAKEKGVPFDNIKEHYEDYEDYLNRLREICKHFPD